MRHFTRLLSTNSCPTARRRNNYSHSHAMQSMIGWCKAAQRYGVGKTRLTCERSVLSEKILMMAYKLPSVPTGSAFVTRNLARQFSRDEMLIVGEKPIGGLSEDWDEDWPETVATRWSLPDGWRGERWFRRIQFPLFLWRNLSAARRLGCTSIVVHPLPFSSLLAALFVAKFAGARIYPYYHNSNQSVDEGTGLGSWIIRKVQAHFFKVARHVFVMSEGLVDEYRQRYPGLDTSALVHTFNGPIPEFESPPEPGSPVKLVYFGNVNESGRDATDRCVEAVRNIDDAMLTFLSATPRKYFEQNGWLSDRISCCKVPEDEVERRIREADIVLLPHGFVGGFTEVEYRTIFPTKTIPYLLSGRPILAHCPKGCFLWNFLKEHECALVVDQSDAKAVEDAVGRLRTDSRLRDSLVKNALKTAEMFQAHRVAQYLREKLAE